MKYRSTLHFCAAVAFAAGLSPLCAAQSSLDRSRVTITRIKPEMLTEWLNVQKTKVVPELKKTGVTTRTVYASGLFGSAFEYVIVQPMTKFADFDSPATEAEALGGAADAQLAEKLRKCTVSSNSFLSTALPDMSIPGDSRNSPAIVRFLRLRVAPGKMQEYEMLFKSEVVPAFRKVNAAIMAARRGVGADGNDVTIEMPVVKFADMDAPPALVRSLGPDGAARLTALFNEIATVVEDAVLIRQPDLSF